MQVYVVMQSVVDNADDYSGMGGGAEYPVTDLELFSEEALALARAETLVESHNEVGEYGSPPKVERSEPSARRLFHVEVTTTFNVYFVEVCREPVVLGCGCDESDELVRVVEATFFGGAK